MGPKGYLWEKPLSPIEHVLQRLWILDQVNSNKDLEFRYAMGPKGARFDMTEGFVGYGTHRYPPGGAQTGPIEHFPEILAAACE